MKNENVTFASQETQFLQERIRWSEDREAKHIDEVQRLRELEIKHLNWAITACEKRMKYECRLPKDTLATERQKLARIRNDVRKKYIDTKIKAWTL